MIFLLIRSSPEMTSHTISLNSWTLTIKDILNSNFKMDDRGELKWFLGMKFTKNESSYSVNQSSYIDKILVKFNMHDCNPSPTPAIEGLSLTKSEGLESTDFDYRGLVGSLLYLMLGTRPNIAWVVVKLSQFLENPSSQHIMASKHVLRIWKTLNTCL